MATLVNYTCKSFIKLAPDKFKAPSLGIRVKKNVGIRRVDGAKAWLWLNWFGRILAVLIYKENKIETGLIERRFYLYFRFQEWSICLIYNKILFLTSLRSRRLEVVGTRSLILREPAARSVGAERDNWWQPQKFAQRIFFLSSSKDHRSMVTAEWLPQSSLL